jgi:hypothetical protein
MIVVDTHTHTTDLTLVAFHMKTTIQSNHSQCFFRALKWNIKSTNPLQIIPLIVTHFRWYNGFPTSRTSWSKLTTMTKTGSKVNYDLHVKTDSWKSLRQ